MYRFNNYSNISLIAIGALMISIALGTFVWRLALLLWGLHLIYRGMTYYSNETIWVFVDRFRRR